MNGIVATEARAHKPAATSAPRPKPRPNPRRRCPEYIARRDSTLNKRGHQILTTAECLLLMIENLLDGDAGDALTRKLVRLGVPEIDAKGNHCLGVLDNLLDDCRGLRWALEQFTSAACSLTLPTAEQEAEMAEELIQMAAARAPRGSR
ncbi:hypothetical protein [Gemmata sp.]|uniref:hypothetical protein n=1 Tax=Gemmata sp. TaxID=1914242 RepID=UPI003F705A22